MMRSWLLSLAGLVFVTLLTIGSTAQGQPQGDQSTLVRSNNQFAVDLYGQLARREGNLFFSPYSISLALAMTYNGARGKTERAMANTLRFELPTDRLNTGFADLDRQFRGEAGKKRPYELNVANALWGEQSFTFNPEFMQTVQKNYRAGLQEVDFRNNPEQSRVTINRWVEKETRDKITDLIPPGVIDPDTRLVLTNAIYFKAPWASDFSERATKKEPFTRADGAKVQTPLMNQTGRFSYHDGGAFQLLELPYQGRELSLVVLLPKKANGLPELERDLTADRLNEWLKKKKPEQVKVTLPKFKTTAQFKMKDVLSNMGMKIAFIPDQADLSGISTEGKLFIQDVIHKAYIDLNEKGTEAAAATAVVVGVTSAPIGLGEPVVFRADRPFLYLIRENRTGSVLFMGRLENPQE